MPLHGARGELSALSLSVEAENRAEANRFMESVLPTLWMLRTTHCRAVPDWPSNIRSANRWF